MITTGEYYFFNKIKDDCNIIFDVGTRDDVHYLDECLNKEFHLFEPNINFFNSLINKLTPYLSNHVVKPNNFGLGMASGSFTYYNNTQSFTKLLTHFKSDSTNTNIFKIQSFNEYLESNNIDYIDFMKIDTEGHELDVIYSNLEFIKNNISYLQFEYSSAWLSNDKNIFVREIYEELSKYFTFYVLKDDAHPFSKNGDYMILMDNSMFEEIDSYMKNGYGYNFGLVKKL